MSYPIEIRWHGQPRQRRLYELQAGEPFKKPIIDFLKILYEKGNISFDEESVMKAITTNQQLQEGYLKIRDVLLENPNLAKLPKSVLVRHIRRDVNVYGRDIEELMVEEEKNYLKGEGCEYVDIDSLNRCVLRELQEYSSLAELLKDASLSYLGNFAVYLTARDRKIEFKEIVESPDIRSVNLGDVIKDEWDFFTSREILLLEKFTVLVKGTDILIAPSKDKKKFVRISKDGSEEETGTIEYYLRCLHKETKKIFKEKKIISS